MNGNGKNACALMRAVQIWQFVLIEANLYLDSHPYEHAALDFRNAALDSYNKAVQCYEENCGPLTAMSPGSKDCWNWVATPWPWEKEANR